jgi:ATP-dependent exoDNAse (exonuclease V) alpha subunit
MSSFVANRKLAIPDAKKRRVTKNAVFENNDDDIPNEDDDEKVDLDDVQQRAVDCVIDKQQNVFITGQAGTGKSFVIGEIVKRAVALGIEVALTATTGLAAYNLESIAPPRCAPQTIHRWAGIGLGNESVPQLVRRIQQNKYTLKRWQSPRLLLIIDEVSMLLPTLLRKLDQIARALRGRPDTPFGGIQMVFVGDFYQLPPVIRQDGGEQHDVGKDQEPYQYCFETPTWIDAVSSEIVLQRIFRQDDEQFVKVLRDVRNGQMSNESLTLLKQRSFEVLFNELIALQKRVLDVLRKKREIDGGGEKTALETAAEATSNSVETAVLRALLKQAGMEEPAHLRVLLGAVEPTKLMTMNRLVDEENTQRLADLSGATMVYESHFDHNVRVADKQDEDRVDIIAKEMKASVTAPDFLQLKIGAQVMLLANLEDSLVNGRRGYIIDFVDDDDSADLPASESDAAASDGGHDDDDDENDDGESLSSGKQRATTTADALTRYNRPGQRMAGFPGRSSYSATNTSAATTSKKTKKQKKKRSDPEPHALRAVGLATATKNDGVPRWPVVEFDNGLKRTIKPYKWERKNAQFKWKASITQLPLKLAYAMSIHKSQSQTLTSVTIDLTSTFASGQTYVALSRATSLDGLVLENYDESVFTAQPPNYKVVKYYRMLAVQQEKELMAEKKSE